MFWIHANWCSAEHMSHCPNLFSKRGITQNVLKVNVWLLYVLWNRFVCMCVCVCGCVCVCVWLHVWTCQAFLSDVSHKKWKGATTPNVTMPVLYILLWSPFHTIFRWNSIWIASIKHKYLNPVRKVCKRGITPIMLVHELYFFLHVSCSYQDLSIYEVSCR